MMVYTSDLRVKNLIKDVHLKVLRQVETIEKTFEDEIFLRVFDQTKEDHRLWKAGGLTFTDPDTGLELGSNDAAWFTLNVSGEANPLVIVEGTYGTERGQFGDGQFNRFSHSLAAVKRGYIAVYMIPFKGESYTKDASLVKCKSKNVRMQYAYVRKPMVKAALNICDEEPGEYLFIDPYEPEVLVEIVVNKFLALKGKQSQLKEALAKAKERMKEIAEGYDYITSTRQIAFSVFDSRNKEVPNAIARIHTQNYAALTTSRKRDAHGLLGKNIAQRYLLSEKNVVSIYLRLTSSDLKRLEKRGGKEISYIFPTTKNLICFDDLIFKDDGLRNEVIQIRNQNLHKNPAKSLIQKVLDEIEKGSILVNLEHTKARRPQARKSQKMLSDFP